MVTTILHYIGSLLQIDLMQDCHVVQFSGGAGSWMAAKRVAERYGTDRLFLVCSDTGSEGPDWLPFVHAAAQDVGGHLVMLKETKYQDLWDLAFQKKIMPSVFRGFCSQIMKVEPAERWRKEICDPATTTIYFGYDWTEEHRLKRSRARLAEGGWPSVEAPLIWEPMMSKSEVLAALKDSGLPFPEAYELGISHNNCLSTGCFKQGEAAWKQLLRVKPDVFAFAETKEQEFIQMLQDEGRYYKEKVGMIYRRPRKGEQQATILTLQDLRAEVENQPELFATGVDDDWGSCACYE